MIRNNSNWYGPTLIYSVSFSSWREYQVSKPPKTTTDATSFGNIVHWWNTTMICLLARSIMSYGISRLWTVKDRRVQWRSLLSLLRLWLRWSINMMRAYQISWNENMIVPTFLFLQAIPKYTADRPSPYMRKTRYVQTSGKIMPL